MRWQFAWLILQWMECHIWASISMGIISCQTFARIQYRVKISIIPTHANITIYNVSVCCLPFWAAISKHPTHTTSLVCLGYDGGALGYESPHCSIQRTYTFLWAVLFTVQNKYICLVINLNDCTTQTMQRRTGRQTVATITFPAWDDNRSSWGPPSYNLTVAI